MMVWKKSIHGNLSWHSVATLVNEAECERDTNNTKRKIDFENGLKDKEVSISPNTIFFNNILIYMPCLFLNLNNL